MDVPDQKGRLAILKVHAKNKKLADEVDLSQIAMRTPGFSGADLANLLNEVCLSPKCGGHLLYNLAGLIPLFARMMRVQA